MPRSSRRRTVGAASALGLVVAFVLVAALGGVLAAGLALPAVGAVHTATAAGAESFDDLPSDLVQTALPEKSKILASDGSLLAIFYDQNRIVKPLSEISVQLQHAVIATEDKRFYEHTGIDLTGTGRALVLSLLPGQHDQQGGSTITQQYVKNMLIEQARDLDTDAEQQAAIQAATASDGAEGYARKLREAKLAITLEQRESKDQILEGYLNIAPFGTSVYGAETAANVYFSKSAKDLTYLEAATIAGITQNPSQWDPTRNPAQSQSRRDVVLMLMRQQGYITQAEYDAGVATPLASTLHVSTAKQGCQTASDVVAGSGYFCDFVTKVILEDPAFGASKAARQALLYKGGLTITTTLDPATQAQADAQVKASVPVGDPSLTKQAMSVVEPGTGQIKAMAQDTDYVPTATSDIGQSALNYNVGYPYYSSNRGFQPGSTFKAFTLLTWLKAGHAIMDTVTTQSTFKLSDFPSSCDGNNTSKRTFDVHNADGKETGTMTVLDATKNSVNQAFMVMATQLDMCDIVNNAASLGVTNALTGATFETNPGDVLGTDSTTPLDMAGAFAAFASGGVYCTPIAILRVQDTSGKDLAVPSANCTQAIDPDIANGINYVLKNVWSGTMKGSRTPSYPAAGKTGTSNNNENTWFVGYTGKLSAAVVVGRVDRLITSNNQWIGGRHYGVIYGSDIAGPTWLRFMNAMVGDQDMPSFTDPSSTVIYGQQVSVPSVIGSSVSAATAALQAAGFDVQVADGTVDSSLPVGTVARQSARHATSGSTITLTLSDGTPPAGSGGSGGGGSGGGATPAPTGN